MDNKVKCLVISGVGALGVGILLIMSKAARHRHCSGSCEKGEKSFGEKLKESKAALDRATAHVQSVFDRIKNRKS
jgi:hypothetical protein